MVFGDGSKLSSDTSESGKETPSPRENVNPLKASEGNKEQLVSSKDLVNKEGQINKETGEVLNDDDGDFSRDSLSYEDHSKYPDDFENENSDGSLGEGNKDAENTESNFNSLLPEFPPAKVHSGLSKSALARVKQRQMEEIRKRELSLIKQKEKEIEERMRAEREAKEAEERKKAEVEKRAGEIKRLEELIKAEEVKKEKEMLERKRLEEENEKRKEEELKVILLI